MSDALIAHSLAEAYFYLMATPCAECGKGPLTGADAQRVDGDGGQAVSAVDIFSTCKTCRHTSMFSFDLPEGLGVDDPNAPAIVNPTDEPSKMLDVAQWITLFRVLTQAAASQEDKQECRRLGLEAAQCLDEALKFYDDPDNDLPPPEAFLVKSSRDRLDRNPEQFSRQRLIELRAKLPTTSTMRTRIQGAGAKETGPRRWWRFWK